MLHISPASLCTNRSMVMRSQIGKEPEDGGDVSFSQYDVAPLARTGWPRRPLAGEKFSTGVTESTKNQNTSSVLGKLNRRRSPTDTSPDELRDKPISVEPTAKFATTTGWDRRAMPATNESDQLPCERARACAWVSAPDSRRNKPGSGKKPVSVLVTSATRITQQRRPPLRKNARTAEGR